MRSIPVRSVVLFATLQERETSISFNQSDKTAEVVAFDSRWMKAIEKLGIWPQEVFLYEGWAQYRSYRSVPKRLLKPPRKREFTKTQQEARAKASSMKDQELSGQSLAEGRI